MLTVQPTTSITVDQNEFVVAKMSQPVQQMIAYFDAWRQREVDLTSELLMVRGALKDLQNNLLATIQQERADAAARAAALNVDAPAGE